MLWEEKKILWAKEKKMLVSSTDICITTGKFGHKFQDSYRNTDLHNFINFINLNVLSIKVTQGYKFHKSEHKHKTMMIHMNFFIRN